MKKRYAIVVAGGNGQRMQSKEPKQFLLLAGLPILMHTLNQFHGCDPDIRITLVLPEKEIAHWNELCIKHQFNIPHNIVPGGASRFHSVKNGLATLSDEGCVAVHDGVRPLISKNLIKNIFEMAEKQGNSVPAIALNESIRKIEGEGNSAADRSAFRIIQTPQCFELTLLKKAYSQDFVPSFTDDASVVEAFGTAIFLIPGEERNIKITRPEDLLVAEVFIKN